MRDAPSIVIADKFETEGVEALRALGCAVHHDPDLGPETIPGAVDAHGAEVLIVRSTKVPAPVFEQCGSLSLVIRAGAGHDTIDSQAAGARGIRVCNCPGMNAAAVAELAIGHMINLDRRICAQTSELKGGRWNKKEYAKANGLKGRRVLVVGLGSIGTEFVTRAQAFGMDISAQSRSLRADTARALGIHLIAYTREALYAAIAQSDIVTVHVALTPDTENLCDERFFGAMRQGAMFLNTSRGEIVDERALAGAVKTKGVRAGLDVYSAQPSDKDTAWKPDLADLPGVSLTHHIGASTDQAQQAVARETVHIVESWIDGGEPPHVVNRDALASGPGARA